MKRLLSLLLAAAMLLSLAVCAAASSANTAPEGSQTEPASSGITVYKNGNIIFAKAVYFRGEKVY